MSAEVQKLLNQYVHWLKQRLTVRQLDEWTEITTPFMDRHNDYLQIYIKKEDDNYILSDDGYIISDLESSGCEIKVGSERKELLEMTLNGFGIKTNSNDELVVYASEGDFARKKHNLIQAMMAVNDLFYTAKPWIESLFVSDVINWLEENDIWHMRGMKFTGHSGYDHFFDFGIQKSRKHPERIFRLVNNPDKGTIERVAFAWYDIRKLRPQDAILYAILNDSDKSVRANNKEALKNCDVKPLLWSEREQFKYKLVA